MAKIIALEECSTHINNITYIYSRKDRKIYFKRLSERDNLKILNIFYEDISDANANVIATENDLITFIQANTPLPV